MLVLLFASVVATFLFFQCEAPPVYDTEPIDAEERQALMWQSEWDMV